MLRRLRTLALALAPIGLSVGLVTLTTSRNLGAAEMAIVFVDIDSTLASVDEGKDAQVTIDTERGKRQGEIGTREAELKKLQDELEKQSKTFSKEALEKKFALYQQAIQDYQAVVMKFNNELQKRQRELFDPIERRLKELLRTVANRDGYDLILDKRAVPFGRKDLDLTDKIIQEYNKTHPGKGLKAPPKKAETPPTKGPVPAGKPK